MRTNGLVYAENEAIPCFEETNGESMNVLYAKPEQYILLSHDRNFEYMGGRIQTNQAPCLIRSV